MHSSVSLSLFGRAILQIYLYTEYQYFLYEIISKLKEKGITFNKFTDHLNKKKALSTRGRKFIGAHVHSIMKRKKISNEKIKEKYPDV